jgi:hypothetical protein
MESKNLFGRFGRRRGRTDRHLSNQNRRCKVSPRELSEWTLENLNYSTHPIFAKRSLPPLHYPQKDDKGKLVKITDFSPCAVTCLPHPLLRRKSAALMAHAIVLV